LQCENVDNDGKTFFFSLPLNIIGLELRRNDLNSVAFQNSISSNALGNLQNFERNILCKLNSSVEIVFISGLENLICLGPFNQKTRDDFHYS